jgi:hypothetical protein
VKMNVAGESGNEPVFVLAFSGCAAGWTSEESWFDSGQDPQAVPLQEVRTGCGD